MVDGVTNAVTVLLNPRSFVLGHVLEVEATVERVAQDGSLAVVGSQDDETIGRGEYIHVGESCLGRDVGQSCRPSTVVVQEGLRHKASSLGVNGVGLRPHREDEHNGQHEKGHPFLQAVSDKERKPPVAL